MMALAKHDLAAAMFVCRKDVDFAGAAKVVPPNQRVCRILPSNHLSCDCIQS